MIVGNSSNGKTISFQVFYYLCEALSGKLSRGYIPDLSHIKLDTIPVDFVVDAILCSLNSPEKTGNILHLCSGPKHSIKISELINLINQKWKSKGVEISSQRKFPLPIFLRLYPLITKLCCPPKYKKQFASMKNVFACARKNQTFANEDTLEFLEEKGMRIPKFSEYGTNVLDYYLEKKSK